jgi:hypothetical protein
MAVVHVGGVRLDRLDPHEKLTFTTAPRSLVK